MSSTAHSTEEHDAFQAQTEAACRKRCCSQIAHYNMQWIKEYKGYKGHVHLIGGFDNIYITLSIPNSVINGRWFPWVEPPSSEAMQMKSKPPQLGHLGQQALPSSEGQRSRWSQCKVHSPRSNNDSLDMSWQWRKVAWKVACYSTACCILLPKRQASGSNSCPWCDPSLGIQFSMSRATKLKSRISSKAKSYDTAFAKKSELERCCIFFLNLPILQYVAITETCNNSMQAWATILQARAELKQNGTSLLGI